MKTELLRVSLVLAIILAISLCVFSVGEVALCLWIHHRIRLYGDFHGITASNEHFIRGVLVSMAASLVFLSATVYGVRRLRRL